jgi:predicted MFS family arabinose efflux permease
MMDLLLSRAGKAASLRRSPRAWIREKNLSRGYWIFFCAAFFFDAGFSIYFFLFNLFLFDRRFNDRSIGWIGGAFTLGSVVGTLPAGVLTRRFGVRSLLIGLFLTAPALNGLRAVWIWEPAQVGLAFMAGLSMAAWGVCFLPAVARLTTEKNRTAGFSLIFSVSVATSILGGLVCGYLRQWLEAAGVSMQPADVKRLILLSSCAIALAGLIPVLRLHVPSEEEKNADAPEPTFSMWLHPSKVHPFLIRFLPVMALWAAVLAAFTPFANIYLTRDLHIPMTRIGLIFSTVQVVQLCLGFATPVVFRLLGLVNGIVASQLVAAVVLALLAGAHHAQSAIAFYLIFSAAQWMSSPGLYNLLMSEMPDAERSAAAAMTLFLNALAGAAATALAGVLFTRFGYPRVLLGIAALALGVSLLFRALFARRAERARR